MSEAAAAETARPTVPAQPSAVNGAALKYDRSAVPTIRAFMQSDAFIRGLMGPIGGGKSSGCVWDLIQRGVRQAPGPDGVRRTRFAVIRNSYRQLADTTIRTVHEWFPPHVFGEWRPSDHRYTIKALRAADNEPPAEIELLFRALDRPDQVGNLLSLELTGAWVNEAREVPWPLIEMVLSRLDRYPAKRNGGASWTGLTLDTNPPDIDSDWYRFFEATDHAEAVAELAEKMPSILKTGYAALFKQPSGLSADAENLANLPAGYYERNAIGKSPDWIKVYLKGEYGFIIDGRPVFPEYSDRFHCEQPNETKDGRGLRTVPGVPIYRGWDFGLTPACVFTQLLPTGQWFIADELVADSLGIDRFSEQVIAHSNQYFPGCPFVDYGDPAGMQRAQTDERTCFEILHAKGIAIEAAEQSISIRLESVRKPLGAIVDGARPQFVIHPRCQVLRRGLVGGYQFRRLQVSGERYTEKPDKNRYSHVADALCYVASRLFGPTLRYQPGERENANDAAFRSRMVNDRSRSLVTGY